MEANKQTNDGQPKFSLPRRGNAVTVAPIRPTVERTHSDEPRGIVASSLIWRLLHSTKILVAAGASVVLVGGLTLIGPLIVRPTLSNASSSSQTVLGERPDYPTLLPNGKSINDLGGWKRVSPPKSDPVFAYTDAIGSVSINVSQQPLPESFAVNTSGKIAELAKAYSATDKLTASDTTVYIGTSAKGPQSVILTKKSLLVLIKSQQKIDDAAWTRYVGSLH